MEDNFKFWMPAEAIEKGSRDKGDNKRWIQGIASTRSQDFQGEVVLTEGIDTSYFKNNGFFNVDHLKGIENKVGEPTECKVTKDGLWVKGFLYEGKKQADTVWEHLNSLKKSGARRKLGFSIEGKVVRRSGTVIEKCFLMDVAITAAPVNACTWAEIAKSLTAQQWAGKEKVYNFDETVALIKKLENLDDGSATTIAKLIFEARD